MNIFIFLCLLLIVYADGQTQKNRSFTKSLKTRNSSATPKHLTENELLVNTRKAFRIRPRLGVRPKIRMCWEIYKCNRVTNKHAGRLLEKNEVKNHTLTFFVI